jgi:hypothetical protein
VERKLVPREPVRELPQELLLQPPLKQLLLQLPHKKLPLPRDQSRNPPRDPLARRQVLQEEEPANEHMQTNDILSMCDLLVL